MKPKIIAFTNLFPLPWEPRRATFNRQQFDFLGQFFDMKVLVPVAWTHYLSAKTSTETKQENSSISRVKYFNYFFTPRIARWSYGLTQFLSTLLQLREFTAKQRPELIFATWVYPDAMSAVLIGKLLRIPVLIKVHGSDINENASLPGVGRQVSWTLKQASGVLAVSQDLCNKVIQLGADPDTTKVIYNGVDLKTFNPKAKSSCRKALQLDEHSQMVLYVGNLKAAKGCLDLLTGFALLLEKQANTKLVYVGEGPCATDIKQNAQALGIEESVVLAGSQDHASLPQWMGAADVVCLASHNEGVPNVLLEAMACGRPVVATAVGGIPEIVPEQAGYLVEKQNTTELADKLALVLTRNWDSSEISAHAAQYSWTRNAAEFTQLFDQIKENNHA